MRGAGGERGSTSYFRGSKASFKKEENSYTLRRRRIKTRHRKEGGAIASYSQGEALEGEDMGEVKRKEKRPTPNKKEKRSVLFPKEEKGRGAH